MHAYIHTYIHTYEYMHAYRQTYQKPLFRIQRGLETYESVQILRYIFTIKIFSCPSHPQVKEDEMGRACSTNGGEEECI
jgi:hypothetical protein